MIPVNRDHQAQHNSWKTGRLDSWNIGEGDAFHTTRFSAIRYVQSSYFPSFLFSFLSMRQTILLLTLSSIILTACGPYQFKGTEYSDPQPAPDFELTATNGERFRLGDHQGQIVLMFFGYTSCPDVCPTTLAEARRVFEGLGDDADKVTFLFTTVDPERDTLEVLGTYVTAFHPAIVGLSGAPDELETVRQDYGIFAEKEVLEGSATGYIVNHTARVFLVDAEGRLRLSYSFGTPPKDILEDIQHLIE
jgi:protein SCO1/2